MKKSRTRLSVAAITCVAASSSAYGDPSSDQYQAASALTLTIPLDNGDLAVADLLENLADSLCIEPPACLSDLNWSINLQAALGPRQVDLIRRCSAGLLAVQVTDDALRLGLNVHAADHHADRLVSHLAAWLNEIAGSPDILSTHSFGISFVTPHNSRAPLADLPAIPSRVVLLVPGLDDAGFIWRDLVPILTAHDYVIARFEYANDGPIADAADFLAAELAALHSAGVSQVDIVAHSMGGLVARDALTRFKPEDSAIDPAAPAALTLPSVPRLILVGTPNHGTAMARFRFVSECREQLVRLAARRGNWDGFSADGNGEAGHDLLPGSAFLCDLNARPLPHAHITVIAGRWIDAADVDSAAVVDGLINALDSDDTPRWLDRALHLGRDALARRASNFVKNTATHLGDGLVSLESACLPGIDDVVILHANHVSLLLRAAGLNQDDLPPAIPVILDRLAASPDDLPPPVTASTSHP